ncbi:hypothetical protein MCM1_0937 [Methanosarcina barkeri CM1]|uniref:Uncharacterized protein n=1 Tax=Methanosarcina barkeri CM1 TaxID=796385 RepID=A0A0G3CBD2_METBA|nr:hypothetical protein MCM1_0937 [Methanosarcina barkeri CM1]
MSGKSGGLLLLSPLGTVRESFPSYGSSVFKPFLYQASVICITDFVILDNSPLTLLSVSLSPTGVFEYLTFVSLFPFTQEKTFSKSASFQIRAKFEPLFNPLQIDIRFLLNPLPSTPSSSLTGIIPIIGAFRAYQVLYYK